MLFVHGFLISFSFFDPDQEKPVGKFCSVFVFLMVITVFNRQKMIKK